MSERFVTITIDGPAGAGKSTVARRVAETLGFEYLDTGALYRAVTLYLMRKSIPPSETPVLRKALSDLSVRIESDSVFVNEADVTADIRTASVEKNVSAYASLPLVRDKLLRIQHLHAEKNDIVADGRDMGTTVFPDACLKIYLVASTRTRAYRRWKDLAASGVQVTMEEVEKQVKRRDTADTNRIRSPLRVPRGAVIIDTSEMAVGEVVGKILENACLIQEKRGHGA